MLSTTRAPACATQRSRDHPSLSWIGQFVGEPKYNAGQACRKSRHPRAEYPIKNRGEYDIEIQGGLRRSGLPPALVPRMPVVFEDA